ncbi:RPSA, partial [Cervus elaphus hippelaphus]
MSGALDVLQMKEEDVLKFLAAGTHLGGTNLDFQMEQYIYKRKSDGIYIINLKRTWEKLLLAARAIVAIENPADVSVISSRNTGQARSRSDRRPTRGRARAGTFPQGLGSGQKLSSRRGGPGPGCREAFTMSGALDVLQMKEEDVLKFLAAGTHLGGTNLDFQMEQYIYKRKTVLKFAAATGATPIAGRFTPGTFTNQIQAAFREPRLL